MLFFKTVLVLQILPYNSITAVNSQYAAVPISHLCSLSLSKNAMEKSSLIGTTLHKFPQSIQCLKMQPFYLQLIFRTALQKCQHHIYAEQLHFS